MPLRAVRFVAIVLTALVLVATGAHLFEFPAKMALGRDEYFVVQESHRGWAFFGFALVGAIAANLILTVMLYGRGVHFALTCMAFLLVTAVLAIFFAGAFPANQETQNWTVIPSDWEELRRQWEYSHAINALLILIAFSALALEAVLPESSAQRRPGAAAQSIAQVEQGEAE